MKSIAARRMAKGAVMFSMIFAAAWLTGCQSLGQHDVGRMVPDSNRVAIPSTGTDSHTFETNDMTVQYQCRKVDYKLKIWGSGKIHFESVRELVFHVYFLDARGKVIGVRNFYSFVDEEDFEILKFNEPLFNCDLTIPAGAVAFAIGYDGQTGGDKDEDNIAFSHFPFE